MAEMSSIGALSIPAVDYGFDFDFDSCKLHMPSSHRAIEPLRGVEHESGLVGEGKGRRGKDRTDIIP